MTVETVTQALHDVSAAIAAARLAIAEGAAVDLTGLDLAVADACAAAPLLSPEEQPAIAAVVKSTAAALDALADDLRRQQASAQGPRAADAYGSGPRR